MEIDPSSLPIRDRYKLLIGCIVPRPIAWVSTLTPAGRENLAPFSFFCGVGSNPLTLAFCPANTGDGGEKDTLRNSKPVSEGGTGEFVVNVVSEPLARRMAACAEELPYGESEFDLADVERAPCRVVRPPRVRASPVAFECRTLHVVRTNPGAPSGGNIVLGEVVHVHVDDSVINERLHTDPERLAAIGRMGGLGDCLTRERFEMPMGRRALDPVQNA